MPRCNTMQSEAFSFTLVSACKDCLGRTPYGSLIATIVVCLGVGLFCGTGFRALDITLNGIFRGLFQMTVPW